MSWLAPTARRGSDSSSAFRPHVSRRKGFLVGALVVVFAMLFLMNETGLNLSFLPYMLILLCPLMHLFMHHGHGSDEGKSSHHG